MTMKRMVGILLLVIGVLVGLYSANMETVTTEQANENLSNAFRGISGEHHDEIYNPELLNRRTNYLIISGVFAISGLLIILLPSKQTS